MLVILGGLLAGGAGAYRTSGRTSFLAVLCAVGVGAGAEPGGGQGFDAGW